MATNQIYLSNCRLEIETQTLKQLKVNLKDALKKSGVLNSVKAQIRKEFITSLSEHHSCQSTRKKQAPDLRERLSLSVVYHFLQNRNYNHAQSVFAAECGLDSKNAWLSEMDIIKSLQFGSKSEVYRLMSEKTDECIDENLLPRKKLSVFDVLLNNLSSETGRDGPVEVSVQTESVTQILGPRESLEHHMQNLRTSFISRRDAEKAAPAKSIEERMILFQRECEERFQRDSENYLNYMRETEICKVRLEEAQKARAETDVIRKELESDYQRRLKEHSERESASVKALADRDRQMQQNQYEARQLMQREIDDLRSREKSGLRKLELECQGLRTLESRLQESKAILESREREIGRREKLAEELMGDNVERAKAEARSYLRSEMEDVNRERTVLKQERQHLHDVRASQEVLLESASSTRKMLREAQAELIVREDDIAAFRAQTIALTERLKKFPDDWFDTSAAADEKIIAMTDAHNSALETLKDEKDKLTIKWQIAESARSENLYKISDLTSTLGEKNLIIEKLKKALLQEKNSFAEAKIKNVEMVRLLKDQKLTVESLVRQNVSTFRTCGVKSSLDDLSSFLASRKKKESYNNAHHTGTFDRSTLPEQPYFQRTTPHPAHDTYKENLTFQTRTQNPSWGNLPSYRPLSVEEFRAREQEQNEGLRVREEQQAAFDRDRTRDQDRHRRDASTGASASAHTQHFYDPRTQPVPHYENAYPHPQVYTAYSSSGTATSTVAAESPQGPLRVSEQLGGGSVHRYQMSTSLDMMSPLRAPHATQAQTGMTMIYSPDRDAAISERVESRGGLSGGVTEHIGGGENERKNDVDKERDRLVDLAVTERIERERVTKESERKTAAAASEMAKLKKEMERQRIEMEEKELEWEAERERTARKDKMEAEKKGMKESGDRRAEEEKIRVNDEAEKREKEREVEREIENRKEKERRTIKENEVMQVETDRCRIIEEEREKESNEKVRLLAEEKLEKDIIAEEKAAAAVESNCLEIGRQEEEEGEEEEEKEEKRKTEKEVEIDSQMAKEAVLSELKVRQNKAEQSEGHSNKSDAALGPSPTNTPSLPWKQKQDSRDSVDFRASETFRDSLDYPRQKASFQEWMSTIEHADEDDFSKLGPYQNGPCLSQKEPMSAVEVREDREGSVDSDAWLEDMSAEGVDDRDGEQEEEREGEEEPDILIQQYDGLLTQELLSSQYKLPESADTVEKGSEDDALNVRESEDDRLARQRASIEMEKKEADDKAIQEARASVVARRKQKLERDSAAASLSSLPSEKLDRVRSSLLASSLPSMGGSKVELYSSSDESHGPVQLDKSKSAMGLYEESVEIESVEDSAEASGDSSGSSSW